MNEKLYILIILGTAREGNESQKATNFLLKEMQKDENLEVEIISVGDLGWAHTTAPFQNKETNPQRDKFERADGFVLVTPEYNHGYPGELKIFLDSMDKEYRYKPFGLCGVSSGNFGGTRVIDHIKPVLIELWAVPTHRNLNFGNIGTLFDEKGDITDEKFIERTETFKNELVWFAKTLKYGRENITQE